MGREEVKGEERERKTEEEGYRDTHGRGRKDQQPQDQGEGKSGRHSLRRDRWAHTSRTLASNSRPILQTTFHHQTGDCRHCPTSFTGQASDNAPLFTHLTAGKVQAENIHEHCSGHSAIR